MADDNSPEYGLAGRNYATARFAKEQADDARAWEAANVAPEARVLNVRPDKVKARIVRKKPKL